jgi:8-oxo-dGTP pyrophosphatase MutT (NUDIX family)
VSAEPALDLLATEVRPAATVMLLRDASPAGSGVEVLMVQRHANSAFAAGMWVFPGGRVDDSDAVAGVPGGDTGPADDDASRRVGVPAGGRAFWVAAARECFEECGVLLATDATTGQPLDPDDGDMAARLAQWRRDLLAGRATLAEVLHAEGLHLSLADVHLVARWVTPPGPPRRFDTRFFVAATPPGQVPSNDTTETVDLVWTRPGTVFERLRAGEVEAMRPTLAQLQSLETFPDTAAVLAATAGFGTPPVIAPVRPRGPINTEWMVAREERWPI